MDREITKEDVRELYYMTAEESQANLRGLSPGERERVTILINEIFQEELKQGGGLYHNIGKLISDVRVFFKDRSEKIFKNAIAKEQGEESLFVYKRLPAGVQGEQLAQYPMSLIEYWETI